MVSLTRWPLVEVPHEFCMPLLVGAVCITAVPYWPWLREPGGSGQVRWCAIGWLSVPLPHTNVLGCSLFAMPCMLWPIGWACPCELLWLGNDAG